MKRSRVRLDNLTIAIGASEYRLMHRRDGRPPVRLYLVEPAEKFESVEAGRATDRRARRKRRKNGGDQPVNMEERHDVKRYVSAASAPSESTIWRAEAVTLRCVNGTIFGREVVPEV